MNALGKHVLAEIYNCNCNILNDREIIESIMVEAALEAGAEVREVAFHKFAPQGVSGVVIISESHLSIHTWPEDSLKYAAIDVFTCGDKINPMIAINFLIEKLNGSNFYIKEFIRGNGEIMESK